MVYAEVDPIELVVCGGAALIISRLVSRSTHDVDIIAIAHMKGSSIQFLKTTRLPRCFKALVTEIGLELGIVGDWLNFAASPLLEFGLPVGIATRLKTKSYGPCLTIYLISRLDQVSLKTYAAMDPQQGERHLSDLLDLKPSAQEVRTAVAWLVGKKVSKQFKICLKQVLERIGHERITREF